MKDCVFCKMVNGGIKVSKIWEDDKYFAFLDNFPVKIGHTLLIPKKHVDYIFDLDDKEYFDLMDNAKKVSKILKDSLNSKKIGIVVEGFEVPHTHVHLVPINETGELHSETRLNVTISDLEKTAKKILKN